MPRRLLRERLGEPESTRFLPRALRQDEREVAVFRYRCDDGVLEVFCPTQLIDGEECVVDGWVVAEQGPASDGSPLRPSGVEHGLFDQPPAPRAADAPPARPPSGLTRQLDFRDLRD